VGHSLDVMSARLDDGEPSPAKPARHGRAASLVRRVRALTVAVRDADDRAIEEAVSNLSRSRRLLAPLVLAIGGVVMLVHGLRVLITNWRLLLVQVLPVAVTWVAMYDLKAHLLSRRSFPSADGPVLIPIGLAIVAVVVASFYANAVFAFAVSQPGSPELRPALAQARRHARVILCTGTVIGVMLAVAVTVISREHRPWFVLSLGIVTGLLMLCYVAVPGRLIGVKPEASRRDKLTASIVAGVIGVVVAAPPYILGRIGVLMLGIRLLFIPGLAIVSVAVALEAGATVAVKSVKMTSKLAQARRRESAREAGPPTSDRVAGGQ
jgi:hypothetical protein